MSDTRLPLGLLLRVLWNLSAPFGPLFLVWQLGLHLAAILIVLVYIAAVLIASGAVWADYRAQRLAR